MSKEYRDVGQFIDTQSGKKRFVKLGSASFGENDDFINLTFDALPIPVKNNFGELKVQAVITKRKAQPPATDGDDVPF